MVNKISTNQIRILSYSIPVIFFSSCLIFFYVNEKAFSTLTLLNILQYNVQNTSYSFIISFFGYTISGILIIALWSIIFWKTKLLKIEAIIFIITGFILIQLGSISYAPIYRERAIYVLVLSWTFILMNSLNYILIAFRHDYKPYQILIALIIPAYMIYDIIIKFILYPGTAITAHVSTAICFLWYFGINRLLVKTTSK